jgi:F-type H+-transporting ATPase subunit b
MGTLATTILFWAQEHAPEGGTTTEHEPSGTDLILPAIDELIWGAVAFAIVLFVLNKYAFPALRKTVEAREQQIQGDLEAAEQAKTEAQQAKANYDQQIADARAEANRIIEEARRQAEDVRKDLIAKAEGDAEQITQRATEQLDAERSRTISELQTTVGDLAIELAEKVVGRALDQGTHRELVDAYIKEVGTMSGNGRNN